jgi:cob(I)alamin adenosyltransferase
MAFKIYTKTGDSGTTGLFGGARLPKYHIRIESYGTVDELNAHLGLLRDQLEKEDLRSFLLRIQDRLFVLGSLLAAEPGKKLQLPELNEEDVYALENAIDAMDAQMQPLKTFILPGGHPTVSQAHVCRCVCRRAERLIVLLHHEESGVDPIIIQYMNRLSDYLFTVARYISHITGVPEIPWIPNK